MPDCPPSLIDGISDRTHSLRLFHKIPTGFTSATHWNGIANSHWASRIWSQNLYKSILSAQLEALCRTPHLVSGWEKVRTANGKEVILFLDWFRFPKQHRSSPQAFRAGETAPLRPKGPRCPARLALFEKFESSSLESRSRSRLEMLQASKSSHIIQSRTGSGRGWAEHETERSG